MSVVAGTPVIDSPKACSSGSVADLDLDDDRLQVERGHRLLDDPGDLCHLLGLRRGQVGLIGWLGRTGRRVDDAPSGGGAMQPAVPKTTAGTSAATATSDRALREVRDPTGFASIRPPSAPTISRRPAGATSHHADQMIRRAGRAWSRGGLTGAMSPELALEPDAREVVRRLRAVRAVRTRRSSRPRTTARRAARACQRNP